MITIFTRAHVSEDLARAWLQHLRDFDTAHPGCHFEVMADAPTMSMAEIVEAVKVNPGLSFRQVIERPRFAAPGWYQRWWARHRFK